MLNHRPSRRTLGPATPTLPAASEHPAESGLIGAVTPFELLEAFGDPLAEGGASTPPTPQAIATEADDTDDSFRWANHLAMRARVAVSSSLVALASLLHTWP